MKSGRAAAWVARSASSSSHLAAISGSGSPRRLHCPPSSPSPPPPSPPPPPLPLAAALFSHRFLFLSLYYWILPLCCSLFRSSFSQRNLRHWKTRLDSEFIKMHAASLHIRPEYLPSFTRGLYFGSTAQHRRLPTQNADDREISRAEMRKLWNRAMMSRYKPVIDAKILNAVSCGKEDIAKLRIYNYENIIVRAKKLFTHIQICYLFLINMWEYSKTKCQSL